jgi:hypothetical protein
VSASTERSARTWPGLLEKLMAVVRTEFRVDLYVPDPTPTIRCLAAAPARCPTVTGHRPSMGSARATDNGGRTAVDLS